MIVYNIYSVRHRTPALNSPSTAAWSLSSRLPRRQMPMSYRASNPERVKEWNHSYKEEDEEEIKAKRKEYHKTEASSMNSYEIQVNDSK